MKGIKPLRIIAIVLFSIVVCAGLGGWTYYLYDHATFLESFAAATTHTAEEVRKMCGILIEYVVMTLEWGVLVGGAVFLSLGLFRKTDPKHQKFRKIGLILLLCDGGLLLVRSIVRLICFERTLLDGSPLITSVLLLTAMILLLCRYGKKLNLPVFIIVLWCFGTAMLLDVNYYDGFHETLCEAYILITIVFYLEGLKPAAEKEPIAQVTAEVAENAPVGEEKITDETVAQLERYKKLFDEGIVTEEEFNQKKKQLLGL
ncbi:MAG: SHOCT domain-containing protein [Clostridia bacterium]|nr:SHOCT domain-containing protein [Clostridia bacterium]